MELYKYLDEQVNIGKNPTIEKFFNKALKQAFSPSFLKEIEDKLNRRLKIKEKIFDGEIEAATGNQNIIIVNPVEFNKLTLKKQVGVLLHEFIHVLQLNKRLFIFSKFKQLRNLTDILYKIVKGSLIKPYTFKQFLNKEREGKGLGTGKQMEIIAYLMNDRLRWEAITPQGKIAFLSALKRSGLFNLNHEFWKQRIKRMGI